MTIHKSLIIARNSTNPLLITLSSRNRAFTHLIDARMHLSSAKLLTACNFVQTRSFTTKRLVDTQTFHVHIRSVRKSASDARTNFISCYAGIAPLAFLKASETNNFFISITDYERLDTCPAHKTAAIITL